MPRKVTAFADVLTGKVYKTEKEATKAESRLNKRKLALLQRRIAIGKYWVPKVGDYVYTDTRISCDHGWDDVSGGLSTVSRVYAHTSGGDANCVFIEIAQHGRNSNWTQFLFPDQAELEKRFGVKFAYSDPDMSPGGNQYDPNEWR